MIPGYAFSVFRGFEEIDRDEPPGKATGGCTEKEFWRFFREYCLRRADQSPHKSTLQQTTKPQPATTPLLSDH